ALSTPIAVVIQPLDAWPEGALGPAFAILPSGLAFAVPAKLTFHYTADEIGPVLPSQLSIGTASSSKSTSLPSTVDEPATTVSAPLRPLAVCGVIGPARADAGLVDAGADVSADTGSPRDAGVEAKEAAVAAAVDAVEEEGPHVITEFTTLTFGNPVGITAGPD